MDEVYIKNKNFNNKMICKSVMCKRGATIYRGHHNAIRELTSVISNVLSERRVNAKRVTHRYEKEQADFDVERPRSRKTRDLLSRKSRKIEREEGTVGGSGEGKCEALARPARFHGFVTFRVATRGLLTPFDCPSKQLRAPRKRSASRTHDASLFFSFSF